MKSHGMPFCRLKILLLSLLRLKITFVKKNLNYDLKKKTSVKTNI